MTSNPIECSHPATQLGGTTSTDEDSLLGELKELVLHAAHLLPSQRPITSFVHHNTVHAFEDLPFDHAMRKIDQVYSFQPYLSEEQFHKCLEKGEIELSDLSEILELSLGKEGSHQVPLFGSRFDLYRAMLQHRLGHSSPRELRWLLAESDVLKKFRSDIPTSTRTQLIQQVRRWTMRDSSYDD